MRTTGTRGTELAALALALGLALATPAAAQQGTVRGRVVDASNGQAVADAAVRVRGTVLVAFTGDDGRFELERVPAGRRTLLVERLGYSPRALTVRVVDAGLRDLEIELQARPVALGEVVTAATKRAASSFDAPVSVTVMESDEIRERTPSTLDEAVAFAPSVQFVGEQLNVRGSSGYSRGTGTRVLLLVDGVPANAGDSGAMNWDMIPLTEVERIEVLKGAGSALYGTSALGGVVNVVTRPAPERARTRIRLRGGFYDDPPHAEWIWSSHTLAFGSAEVVHGRRLGPLGVWLRAGRAEDDGYRENDDAERTNYAAKLELGGGDQSLRLFASWARERHGNPFIWCTRGQCEDRHGLAFQPLRLPEHATDDRTRSDKTLIYATHEWDGGRLSSFARVSYQRNDWRTSFAPDDRIGARTDRFGGELRAGWLVGSPALLTLGVEATRIDVDADIFGEHDVTDLAGFGQLELSPLPWLTLTAGARADLRLIDGGSPGDPWSSELSPRLGLVLSPDPATRVRASVGRGFRNPTVAELFTATELGGFLVVPNDSLSPERSWAGELGVQRVVTGWLSLDVAGFFYDFENLIEADTLSGGAGELRVSFRNLPDATVQGLEAIARLSLFGDRLRGRVGYTLLDSEEAATGRPLPYRPDGLLTASGTLSLGALDLGADYRRASAFDRVQVFTDERLDPRVPMRVLDLRLAYRFGDQTFRFSVDNATNYGYTTIERNLEPIRHYTAALELLF